MCYPLTAKATAAIDPFFGDIAQTMRGVGMTESCAG